MCESMIYLLICLLGIGLCQTGFSIRLVFRWRLINVIKHEYTKDLVNSSPHRFIIYVSSEPYRTPKVMIYSILISLNYFQKLRLLQTCILGRVSYPFYFLPTFYDKKEHESSYTNHTCKYRDGIHACQKLYG